MLKVLVIATPKDQLRPLDNAVIAAKVQPGAQALDAMQKASYDLIVVGNEAAVLLNQNLLIQSELKRKSVMASTHQGIQLVPISEIYYFQAEHKYVVTYHVQGQLLIDDSLDKLEHDFADDFVRIHRKTLVSLSKIEKLTKNDAGQHYIKMRNSSIELPVSRRQLPNVRKKLLCM